MSEVQNQNNASLVHIDDGLFIPGAIISNTMRDSNSNSQERLNVQRNMGVTKSKYSGSTLTLNLSPSHRYDRNSHAQFLFATQQCKREISFIALASDHQSMLGKKLALSTTKNLPFVTLSPITDPNHKVVISSKHV